MCNLFGITNLKDIIINVLYNGLTIKINSNMYNANIQNIC